MQFEKNIKLMKIDAIGPNEEVIKVLHRNWFDIASQYFVVFGTMLFFLVAFIIYPIIFPELQDPSYKTFTFFIFNTLLLACWMYGFLIWIDYYFDIWIITSEKIINIEQKGLFVRRVSEARYEKIQDVTVEMTGIIQTVINYGDVLVQTAGETNNITFRKISSPNEIKNLIVKMQKEKETKRTHDFEEAIKEGLSVN